MVSSSNKLWSVVAVASIVLTVGCGNADADYRALPPRGLPMSGHPGLSPHGGLNGPHGGHHNGNFHPFGFLPFAAGYVQDYAPARIAPAPVQAQPVNLTVINQSATNYAPSEAPMVLPAYAFGFGGGPLVIERDGSSHRGRHRQAGAFHYVTGGSGRVIARY